MGILDVDIERHLIEFEILKNQIKVALAQRTGDWDFDDNSLFTTGKIGVNTTTPDPILEVKGVIGATAAPLIIPSSAKGVFLKYNSEADLYGSLWAYDYTGTTYLGLEIDTLFTQFQYANTKVMQIDNLFLSYTFDSTDWVMGEDGTADFMAFGPTTSNKHSIIRQYAADGDGTDSVFYEIVGYGDRAGLTNYHIGLFGWNRTGGYYAFYDDWGGDQTAKDIRFYTGTDTDQLVLDATNGRVGIENATPATTLDVGGIITWTGGNSTNANTAYTHSQDNSQAHSDYMLNTGDTTTGNYTFVGDFTIDTPTFFVDASQSNIGFGTITPHVTTTWHFWYGDAGTDPTWVPNDMMIIESDVTGVMQFFTPTNVGFYLEWSDSVRAKGLLGYSHSSDELLFWTNGGQAVSINCAHGIKVLGIIESETSNSPNLTLDQNSNSGVFIDFQGSTSIGYCNPFSTAQGSGSVTGPKLPSGSPNAGWAFSRMVRVKCNGCDTYYMPIYIPCANA